MIWITNKKVLQDSIISTAVILAAGNGVRLSPLTNNLPKCLIKVNGISILCNLLDSLHKYRIKNIIFVVGYLGEKIIRVIQENEHWKDFKIEFVFNDLYSTTNNIYSLWLTRNLIKESFLLIESDIIFDPILLAEIMIPDRIAISNHNPSMTGTTVKLNSLGIVSEMKVGKTLNGSCEIKKTVNICSLSLSSWSLIKKELDQRINKGELHDFYEIVFSKLIDEGNLILQGINFETGRWYEIDTLDDLKYAEKLSILNNMMK